MEGNGSQEKKTTPQSKRSAKDHALVLLALAGLANLAIDIAPNPIYTEAARLAFDRMTAPNLKSRTYQC
jgi:hypothetical protein